MTRRRPCRPRIAWRRLRLAYLDRPTATRRELYAAAKVAACN